MDPMTLAMGASMIPTLFGSGGNVKVPGALAAPTDPTSKFVDEGGMLRDQFKTAGLTNESLDQGKGLLGNLMNRATAQGPSQGAQALMGASDLGSQTQRDQLANQQASGLASQQANMAMKGGMGTGSAERMAGQANQQSMAAGQDINRQNELNKLNIQSQDENQKLGLLKNLPGQFQSFGNNEMNRQVNDIQGGQNLLMNKYKADQQAFGANQMAIGQANAQNASSKGLLGGLF